MGLFTEHMSVSQRLADTIGTLAAGYDVSDLADLTSTVGYDNDGSTGVEMIDNGVGLALAAVKYDPEAKIFYAVVEGEEDEDGYSESTAYYQYGKDEEDAVRRLLLAAAR